MALYNAGEAADAGMRQSLDFSRILAMMQQGVNPGGGGFGTGFNQQYGQFLTQDRAEGSADEALIRALKQAQGVSDIGVEAEAKSAPMNFDFIKRLMELMKQMETTKKAAPTYAPGLGGARTDLY